MRGASVVFLAFFAQANAKESKDPMDDLVDHLVDRLFGTVATPALPGAARVRGPIPRALPRIPHGTALANPMKISWTQSGLGCDIDPRTQRPVVAKGHFTDCELKFHYEPVKFDYKDIKAKDIAQLVNEGWTLLDVRAPEQIARAQVKGAVEVPLYVLKNDFGPLGIYQELSAFSMGGWWNGGRPMKENWDFVKQVKEKISPLSPGIIVACQTGLRSKQAMKELHLAGYPRLASLEGGFHKVKRGDLECADDEECELSLANSGNVAGMLGWKSS